MQSSFSTRLFFAAPWYMLSPHGGLRNGDACGRIEVHGNLGGMNACCEVNSSRSFRRLCDLRFAMENATYRGRQTCEAAPDDSAWGGRDIAEPAEWFIQILLHVHGVRRGRGVHDQDAAPDEPRAAASHEEDQNEAQQ